VARLWEVASGRLREVLPAQTDPQRVGAINAMAWSPDGKRLAESRDAGDTVWVWDLATRSHQELPMGDESWTLAWSPDGQRLTAGCLDGTVVVGDLRR
jgi:WD40 repeat protein